MLFPIDTGVHFNDLEDCADNPPQFIKRYTVTGQVVKQKQRRTHRLGRTVHNINGQDVILWRYGHQVYATGPHCPHQQSSLELADVEDLGNNISIDNNSALVITCPAHGWRFKLCDGELNRDQPQCGKLPTFSTAIDPHTGSIAVLFPSLGSQYFDLSEEDDEFSRTSVWSH